ncbi:hypothetical protein AB0I28_24920 [Phytomonospora sp. NPDC050363]|uniref:hypothetical protein n=1 Tax=Phytomonospora sp. NPDC050363 TaxID=3155642 RepID=UPI00340EE97B
MPSKSHYELHFAVSPGAIRKDVHAVRATLAEIAEDLKDQLTDSIGVYLLCWARPTLALHAHEKGERIASVRLHPFVTVSVEGFGDITFTRGGKPVGIPAGDAGAQLRERIFAGELDDSIRVTVDWDRVEIPALSGELAGEDDVVGETELPYGVIDLEE